MKVHFSASTEKIDMHISTYRKIIKIIEDHGDEVARNWISDAYQRFTADGNYNQWEASEILLRTKDAIAKSDIAIFESTVQSFGVGYQAALAISLQKPILILQKRKARPLGAIGIGTNSLLKRYCTYNNEKELANAITNFIDDNNSATKDVRFNMVLERDLLFYLTNESEESGVSKSQIVRNLLRAAIKNKSGKL